MPRDPEAGGGEVVTGGSDCVLRTNHRRKGDGDAARSEWLLFAHSRRSVKRSFGFGCERRSGID
jgi:hypothetical protein